MEFVVDQLCELPFMLNLPSGAYRQMSESCSIRSAPQAWSAQSPVELVQRFPTDGLLADNLNLSLASLTNRVRKVPGRTYSCIVRTVRLDRPTLRFQQRGSAPNFQGGLLTLCTCKYQMRSSLTASEWDLSVNRPHICGAHLGR